MPALITRFGWMTAVLFLLPWLALIGLGGYWLWQQGWIYQGLGILSADLVLVYGLLHWRRQADRPLLVQPIEFQPDPNWPDEARQAWQGLKPITERWLTETDLFTDSGKLLKLTNEVLTQIARHFHADSKYPLLEFPLPYLLKLIVLVCEDIQRDVLDKIPGSHAVRVGDLLRVKRAADAFSKFKFIFDAGHWLFNWSGAALAKARGLLISKGLNTVTDELARRLISAYISKLGYYAIQLYSGQLTLDDMVPTERLSPASQHDLAASEAHDQSMEPLRLLVLGQIGSGKSSLINALFGEIKSAEGLLPTTADFTPYLLDRDGLQQAIILDSAGYGGLMHESAPEVLKRELINADVIFLVCNAAQAARQIDAQQLDAIRHYFQEQCPNQALPVIIAIATHIDRLRPVREWRPPYNIQQPDCAKAHSIRQACTTIAQELSLPSDCIVPVCLSPEQPAYNIEDGLIPLIHEHLDAAQRVRYLRCLRRQQAESYWRQWRKQALQAGRLLFKMGGKDL